MRKNNRKYCICIVFILLLLFCLPVSAAGENSISLNKTTATMKKGKKLKLKATVTGKKGKIKWKSSKPSVATVNSKGVVKAKKAGSAIITAKANGKKAKCKIKVTSPNYVKEGEYSKEYKTNRRVDANPADYLLVLSYSKNKIKFVIGEIGPNASPFYETNVITATIKNNKVAPFKWEDSFYHKGKGSIIFKKNKVTIKMSGKQAWYKSITLPYRGKIAEEMRDYYLSMEY